MRHECEVAEVVEEKEDGPHTDVRRGGEEKEERIPYHRHQGQRGPRLK